MFKEVRRGAYGRDSGLTVCAFLFMFAFLVNGCWAGLMGGIMIV